MRFFIVNFINILLLNFSGHKFYEHNVNMQDKRFQKYQIFC